MKNVIFTTGVLAVFFLVLTEKITITNIIFSLIVSIVVYKLNTQSGKLSRLFNTKTIKLWLLFVPILFFEVVKANLQVARIALSVDMKLDPKVVIYKSRISDPWLLTILANVITLTPGTMSVDISDNMLQVHCLNQTYADGLGMLALEKLLFRIEGGCVG